MTIKALCKVLEPDQSIKIVNIESPTFTPNDKLPLQVFGSYVIDSIEPEYIPNIDKVVLIVTLATQYVIDNE